jgi:hypothetical protein
MQGNLKVSFVGDLPLPAAGSTFVVAGDGDYVQFCHAVAREQLEAEIHEVWVKSKVHYTWIANFLTQMGVSHTSRETTPRDVLAEQLQVTLPQWLTDDEVTGEGLLDITPEERFASSVPFEERMLALFFGEVFYDSALDSRNFAEVVSVLIEPQNSTAFSTYPVLQRCLGEKCQRWRQNTDSLWVQKVCETLPHNADLVWQWTTASAYLSGYPPTLLEWVVAPEHLHVVRRLPRETAQALPPHPDVKRQTEDQIIAYFREKTAQVQSRETFREVLNATSGQLSVEFEAVLGIVTSGHYQPDASDVDTEREHFSGSQEVDQSRLASLSYYVPQPDPTLMAEGEEWSAEDWINWTVKEYLPYREYQCFHRMYREDLEKTVVRFSDWYIREYSNIQSSAELSLAHSLSSLSHEEERDTLTVLLMVDCLPIHYSPLIESALKNIGFSRHKLTYRFAALPTTTEYNKASILRGQWVVGENDYGSLMEQRASEEWDGVPVRYAGTLKQLSQLRLPEGQSVLLVNFIQSDQILHTDVTQENSTYEDELSRYFHKLAEALSAAIEKWPGNSSEVTLHLLTDHGATRIMDEERHSFDSQVVNKLFSDEKYRNARIQKEKQHTVPKHLWDFGHAFTHPFLDEEVLHFLPKGHNTVRKTARNSGYLHGGVTPEEVIVPVSTYRMSTVAWEALKVRYPNLEMVHSGGTAKFYIKRVVTIQMELQNLNSEPADVKRIELAAPEADLKHVHTEAVPAQATGEARVSCYFYESALESDTIELHLTYEIAGEEHTLELTIPSEFKSAMSGGLNLRDL